MPATPRTVSSQGSVTGLPEQAVSELELELELVELGLAFALGCALGCNFGWLGPAQLQSNNQGSL